MLKDCATCGGPRDRAGQRNCRPCHAHHEDYARPLDVTWLCRTCHYKRHRSTLNGDENHAMLTGSR